MKTEDIRGVLGCVGLVAVFILNHYVARFRIDKDVDIGPMGNLVAWALALIVFGLGVFGVRIIGFGLGVFGVHLTKTLRTLLPIAICAISLAASEVLFMKISESNDLSTHLTGDILVYKSTGKFFSNVEAGGSGGERLLAVQAFQFLIGINLVVLLKQFIPQRKTTPVSH